MAKKFFSLFLALLLILSLTFAFSACHLFGKKADKATASADPNDQTEAGKEPETPTVGDETSPSVDSPEPNPQGNTEFPWVPVSPSSDETAPAVEPTTPAEEKPDLPAPADPTPSTPSQPSDPAEPSAEDLDENVDWENGWQP